MNTALPPIVDAPTWRRQLDELRVREKAATRELDAIAAARRRLPMVKMPDYAFTAEDGRTVGFVDLFADHPQLIVYNHMWTPGAAWQCPGCTGLTSMFTRLDWIAKWDARFVVVTHGTIDEIVEYKRRTGNQMTWYSSAGSTFSADTDSPPGGGFGYNVFLRDGADVYRTWHTTGRGSEQLNAHFGLIDILPYGRQEDWQDSPPDWPQGPAYARWQTSQEIAARYGAPT